METATREILWNVNNATTYIVMYSLFAVSLVVAASGLYKRVFVWTTGKPANDHLGRWFERVSDFVDFVVFQKKVLKSESAGLMHLLLYIGFLALLFATTMVFIHHDLGIRIYQGDFYLWVTIFSDLLGLGLLIGCAIAAHRRYIRKLDYLHNRQADLFLLAILGLLVVQGFFLEALRIYVTEDPWKWYSPVGAIFAKFFWPLTPKAASLLHFVMWWFHAVTVFIFIALIPYTKFFHVLASSINLFFRANGRPKGALSFPGDLEKLIDAGEEFSIGLQSIKDYSWKQLLDLDACTSCGRCQDACPAYASGKPLSPKWMILDTRNHLLALTANGQIRTPKIPTLLNEGDKLLSERFFLEGSGVKKTVNGYESKGAFRGANVLVQRSAGNFGISADQRISGEVMDSDVFWSCVTCMACVEACPVGINHVDLIVSNRRNMALMHGEIPSEAQATLKALETRGTPFGSPNDRAKWAEGLNVKTVKPGDSIDVLYWVGCISSFDPRKQKIARALVTLLKRASVNFAILGNAECCSGDPARRLGEENLFQALAKKNIETLKSISFNKVITNCPHCFNTLKNEYPQISGSSIPVLHHSVFIAELIQEGKLTFKESQEEFTFHDSCYLGRYNDEYEAPRASLRGVKGLKIVEMEKSRDKGMCCGAGGGHFWMDMKIGERINVLRVNQAAETGVKSIASACPFCMQMLEDGVKLTNREGETEVRDIAEVLAERLTTPNN